MRITRRALVAAGLTTAAATARLGALNAGAQAHREGFAARLRAIEDRQTIIEAVASYGDEFDEVRLPEWLEKFTPEATFTVQIRGVTVATLTGRDAIAAYVAPRQTEFQQKGIRRQHTMSSIIVDEVTPTLAEARS